MRVLLVDDSLDMGGKERQFLTSLKVLRQMDISVHVALLREKGKLGDLALDIADGHLVCGRKAPFSAGTVRKIHEYIAKNDIDLVHCNGVIDALHVFLATLDIDLKRVCTVHGHETGKHLFVHRNLLSRFDGVIAVSESFLESLRADGYRARRFFVIPNSYGVDFELKEPKPTMPGDDLKAVMVSRFDSSKDHLTVIRALRDLIDSGFSLKLDLIGAGARVYQEAIEAAVDRLDLREHINFLGSVWVTSDVLSRYDLMIQSSTAESFGIALIEGMASGLPVIASDIPPFREIIGDMEYGMLFSTGDGNDLMGRIIELTSSESTYLRLSELSIERAKEFSPEMFGKRTSEMYRELICDDTGSERQDT